MMIQQTPLLIQRWGFSFSWIPISTTLSIGYVLAKYEIRHNCDNIDLKTKIQSCNASYVSFSVNPMCKEN